jgi:hypothetical protein
MKAMGTTLLAGLLALTAMAGLAAQTISVSEDTAWRMYNEQRATKVVFRNRLVERSSLTPVTGFVVQMSARISDGNRSLRGGLIELADFAGNTNSVATLSLRPNLWKRTGKRAFLQDYEPAEGIGILTRIYVSEVKSIGDVRVFHVAK